MAIDLTAWQSEVVRALAEPLRWKIIERLAQEELCVCHLVEDLDVPQPLVSHHLKVLRSAGVVEPERFKQWTYYRLIPALLAEVGQDLTDLARSAKAAAANRRPCC